MDWDWKYQGMLRRLEEGCTFQQAAECANLSRQAVWKHLRTSPEFREAVALALEKGCNERAFRAWLYHPFRGKRPPTGKGHGGKPIFTWGLGARSGDPRTAEMFDVLVTGSC
jgi:hypothetical protein